VSNIDKVWENEIYGQGKHLNRYPFDVAVTFVFRHAPRDRPRSEVRILEIGSGAGNNLWFAAREGFQVTGIEGSASAVAHARKRFADEGLSGEFIVGDFTSLPFEDGQFDLVIDRGSLTCCGFSAAQQAVGEVRRVLVPGGTAFFNPYSERHSSYTSATAGPDGLRLDAREGTLVGVGGICYYGRRDVERLLGEGWELVSVQHMEMVEMATPQYMVHAEWRVIARKAGQ
jgi:SAM-dependent methyltransferase